MSDDLRTELAEATCEPCRGGIPPLPASDVARQLEALPQWTLGPDGKHIARRFTFRTFAAAFALVQQIAALAEEQQHHPDICFGWGYVNVSVQTKAIDGLHRNDFILAAKIDQVAG